jgi:hypothetical protein
VNAPAAGVMAAVKGQALAIVPELPLQPVKLLFVFAKVASAAGLRKAKNGKDG